MKELETKLKKEIETREAKVTEAVAAAKGKLEKMQGTNRHLEAQLTKLKQDNEQKRGKFLKEIEALKEARGEGEEEVAAMKAVFTRP